MLELTLRIGLSLLVVFGLLWTLVRLARGPASRRGRCMQLLARQQLTRGSAVAVVRVADRALVLGVSDHGVTLLTETDLDAVSAPVAEPGSAVRCAVRAPDVGSSAPVGVGLDRGPLAGVGAGLDRGPLAGVGAGLDRGPLAGSLLSPGTWRDTVEFFRNRTVRKP